MKNFINISDVSKKELRNIIERLIILTGKSIEAGDVIKYGNPH